MTEHEREAYEEKARAELDQLEARLEEIKAKAREAKADAKIEGSKWLDELTAKSDEAGDKLAELRRAGEASWSDFKSVVEEASSDLRRALDDAARRFSKS